MRSETLRLRNGTGTPFGNLRPRKEGHYGYLQTVAQVHENSVATVSSVDVMHLNPELWKLAMTPHQRLFT